ncbi:hypothetical protein [Streptomyces cavernae]|uniref:hypothetical protein n=1 Tax=Streptomyces cavernae TaxID=2259034 RepID=UPI000FEB9E75|nr:hypothetical protein [Streptomyces cavernae]
MYVETRIRGTGLEELWARTQEPAQHQRWDVRFTEIDHLPRAEGEPAGAEGEPRKFRYATRVLPFLTVAGTGVSAGERERPDGTRTSALRFTSPHPLSLLAEGSGYWRYVPDGDGVRFLTGYDYRPRWGRCGVVADRLLFRPLMGWATAWSFDRLRIWLEHGITPERARLNWLVELLMRGAVIAVACSGVVWVGHLPAAGPSASFLSYWMPVLTVLTVLVALLAPPRSGTPAARRCRRTTPSRARAPRVLRTLEQS